MLEIVLRLLYLLSPWWCICGISLTQSMTDQGCSLDKMILSPDIITACDSRLPNKIHRRFELHRYILVLLSELCCLGRRPTVCPIFSNTSSFVRTGSRRHSTFLDLAHVCQRGLPCKREGETLAAASCPHLCSSQGR